MPSQGVCYSNSDEMELNVLIYSYFLHKQNNNINEGQGSLKTRARRQGSRGCLKSLKVLY